MKQLAQLAPSSSERVDAWGDLVAQVISCSLLSLMRTDFLVFNGVFRIKRATVFQRLGNGDFCTVACCLFNVN